MLESKQNKKSGVLMPIFSLPSNYGIGTLGEEAYRFIDVLVKSRQNFWQVLPLNPTSYGDSPYQSPSAFAGNPYFIDLDFLCKDGLLTEKECRAERTRGQYIDYARLYRRRIPVLRKAYGRFKKSKAFDAFLQTKKENKNEKKQINWGILLCLTLLEQVLQNCVQKQHFVYFKK